MAPDSPICVAPVGAEAETMQPSETPTYRPPGAQLAMNTSHASTTPVRPEPALRKLALAAALALGAAAGLSGTAIAAPVPFSPLIAGQFDAGGGADATFYKIDNAWKGSTVLWDEDKKQYGSGQPIGTFAWGTGLWGRADFNTIQAAGAAGQAPVTQSWSGVSGAINYGNLRYNTCHSSLWGNATPVPFPQTEVGSDPDCGNAEGADPSQDNWTASFAGYIRIVDAGAYNFSVLNDDGFFFSLIGAGGATQSIGRDFLNPRERNGFGTFFDLEPGLYGFELGAWNRRGAGVVDLRWLQGETDDTWELVPVTELLTRNAVPEPSTALLLLAAAGLFVAGRRRTSAARATTAR